MSVNDQHACDEYRQLSRRQVLKGGVATAAALTLPAWMPRISFADGGTGTRDVLISIYLRGGADGLSLCVPHGDPLYYQYRPYIAVPEAQITDLDGYFGLPPQLFPLHEAYVNGDFAIVHAVGRENWTRSHFEAQKYMEASASNPNESGGWIGRHLASMAPSDPNALIRAIAFSGGMPRSLNGTNMTVATKDPSEYVLTSELPQDVEVKNFLMDQYLRQDDITREVVRQGNRAVDALASVGFKNYAPSPGVVYENADLGNALKNSAALIKADLGVEAIHMDVHGWDTHSTQGTMDGDLAVLMTTLGNNLGSFYRDMMSAGQTRWTAVVISEFGRQIEENGSFGTDHGSGMAMFVLGPGVNGGQVIRDWPGLEKANMYGNYDLWPTTDYRNVLAEILQRRTGNTNMDFVFPDHIVQPLPSPVASAA